MFCILLRLATVRYMNHLTIFTAYVSKGNSIVGGQGAGARENRRREGYGRWEKKGREAGEKFKKGSVRYLLLLIIQSKTQTQQRFLTAGYLTLSEASNKILYARKRKFLLGLKNMLSFGEIVPWPQRFFLIFLRMREP